ncbi:MAG TPA: hypothetical protein VI729_04045 [Anaerolineales bacterium]|nr:hypothetical protein [Anaerolineales bacterium]
MPTFSYSSIVPGDNACSITSTDSRLLISLSNELKAAFPMATTQDNTLPSGEHFELTMHFHGLTPKDGAAQAWFCFNTLLRYLCDRGWEPFAVHAEGEQTSTTVYHFRLLR